MKELTTILIVLLMMFGLMACSGNETDAANVLIIEGNKLSAEGTRLSETAETKKKELEKSGSAFKDEETRKKAIEFQKKELIPLLDLIKEKYLQAGDKFEAASNLKIQEKFKDYLEIKAADFRKRAEYIEQQKAFPKALAESKTEAEYQKKSVIESEKLRNLQKEAQDLIQKAEKIKAENPGSFKSAQT